MKTVLILLLHCVGLFGSSTPVDKMDKAYEMADTLFRGVLEYEKDGATRKEKFEGIQKDDVIVVSGAYDNIEDIFRISRIPHRTIAPNDLHSVNLRPSQIVFVNCAISFPQESAKQLAAYVEAGGRLITTDWALKNVLEVAFPGFVKHNGKLTADEVVPISHVSREDPVLFGFLEENVATTSPMWWLEFASYPIQILDTEKVQVLATSEELGRKYEESAVIVKFRFGKGVVYHLISHFYLQRSELREEKQSGSSYSFAEDKGSGKSKGTGGAFFEEDDFEAFKDVNYGDVEAASASYEFVARNLIEHAMEVAIVPEKEGVEKEKEEL